MTQKEAIIKELDAQIAVAENNLQTLEVERAKQEGAIDHLQMIRTRLINGMVIGFPKDEQ